jgi:ADP-ribosylglycohydrolase
MPLFLFITQTIHIKSITHNSIAMISGSSVPMADAMSTAIRSQGIKNHVEMGENWFFEQKVYASYAHVISQAQDMAWLHAYVWGRRQT